ncbi:hypothetical protein [Desulfofundulus salinus]|uniref:hypothetical protein n=1 Tax=Desulfofundulus salinus TaxID=2419843 RepID=UPI000F64CAF3|nr:hypothetical protein [Desulfofundulus salinum]
MKARIAGSGKKPAALKEVVSLHPILPAPHLEEELTVLVYYSVAVVLVASGEIATISGRCRNKMLRRLRLSCRSSPP